MTVLALAFTVLGCGALMGNASGTTAFAAEADNVCAHEYETFEYAPTCTNNGFTEYTCSVCGDVYRDNYVQATGHSYTDVVIEPTCTHKGFTTHFCNVCGYEYADNYVEATGHTYDDVIVDPTCTEQGYTTHTCLV